MPNLHDIERRIKSVSSTKQITRTMQMVAAAKIRHSTERVEAATPYGEAVKEMLANVARMGGTDCEPLATAHDEVKKTPYCGHRLRPWFGWRLQLQRAASCRADHEGAQGSRARRSLLPHAARRRSATSSIVVSIRCLPSATCPLILASKRLMPWLTTLWSITSLAKLTR